jgi:hypothetical protein
MASRLRVRREQKADGAAGAGRQNIDDHVPCSLGGGRVAGPNTSYTMIRPGECASVRVGWRSRQRAASSGVSPASEQRPGGSVSQVIPCSSSGKSHPELCSPLAIPRPPIAAAWPRLPGYQLTAQALLPGMFRATPRCTRRSRDTHVRTGALVAHVPRHDLAILNAPGED